METGPPLFTQLRMIFTCSLRQATVREHGVDEHVKCTAHQIPNEFRIAYSAQAAIVLSQGCLPFEVVAHSPFVVRRIISFQHGEVLAVHADIGFLDSLLVSLLIGVRRQQSVSLFYCVSRP
jgi:hypothetical protein